MEDAAIQTRPHLLSRWGWPGDLLRSRKIAVSSAIATAIVMDMTGIIGAGILTEWYRLGTSSLDNPRLFFLMLPAYWLVAPVFRIYSTDVLRATKGIIIMRSLAALTMASGVALLAAFAFNVTSQLSIRETLYFLGMVGVLLTMGRALTHFFVGSMPHRLDKLVAVLGDGSMSVRVSPDKMVDIRSIGWEPSPNRPDFLDHVFRTFSGYDRIVLAFSNRKDRLAWTRVMQLTGLDAEVLEPYLTDVGPIAVDRWGGQPTLVVSRGPLTLAERFIKRAFDTVLTLAAMPIWVPLIAVLAVLVRIDSPGAAFFAQQRVGRNNRHYVCYKLRTMRTDVSDGAGQRLTERNDPRITRLGAFLRRASLDELPQLFNVLKGEMSLVGPRPHPLGATTEGNLYWEAIPGYWCRHAVKPGITGLAQVRGYRGPTERKRELELRVSADLEYIHSWSIWLDITIIVQTIRVVMHPNAF